MTTIHVRYEILGDPTRLHPDSAADAYPWVFARSGCPEMSALTELVTLSSGRVPGLDVVVMNMTT